MIEGLIGLTLLIAGIVSLVLGLLYWLGFEDI